MIRPGQIGGNRKPQRFKDCDQCGVRFGPLDRRSQRFCSAACKVKGQRVEQRKPRAMPTPEARRAQRRIRHLVDSGQMVRPQVCEECGTEHPRIEAAHHDYRLSEDVRWLCPSCHRRWDLGDPKGGTIVARWEKHTGQQAQRP